MSDDVAVRGRPSVYDPEIAQTILERLSDGETLRAICRTDGMPPESTVRKWALQDREGFGAQYTHAREIGFASMAEQVVEIADSSGLDPADKRIRFDARRWLLSKALPKVYGDKISQEISGPDGGAVKIERIELVACIPDLNVDGSS